MGILRTDKISGLETPTAVTGSVVFDGTGDHLDIGSSTDFAFGTGDFTIETWVNFQDTSLSSINRRIFSLDASDNASDNLQIIIDQGGATLDGSIFVYSNSILLNANTVINDGAWHHIAVARSGSTIKLFVDGTEKASASNSVSYSPNSGSPRPVIGAQNDTGYYNGYISNFRILKGTALYTSDFTVPTHELEVIGDTVLLCCNNSDSAGAASNAGIGTAHVLTVTGDAAASSVSPGLARDFTFGTEFKGVTTFDTQGYFVPPSGTTEQRGNDRGVFGGGENPSANNVIQFVNTSSSGISQDFGDLVRTQMDMGATGSQTRGLFAGGDETTAPLVEENTIQFITIASTGNALDFGDLTGRRKMVMGGGTSTRGVFGGGSSSPGNHESNIDYVTVASLGNAQDFGDLDKTPGERGASQVTGSPTRGIFYIKDNSINYITWATLGNALDFGDTDNNSGGAGAVGDKTRSCMHGSTASYNNSIEYITISTLGNGQDFGDLTETMRYQYGASNPTRGVMAGDSNNFNNTINFITIQTTGNAKNFGDLSTGQQRGIGLSGCHGGIS